MKFAYGISDFHSLIKEDYLYVDRTDRIPLIESAGKQLLFLRPRRFGKSLLLNMLMNYYDIAKADEFETLFGQLAIAQQPTEKRNQYLVMKWDFSSSLAMGSTEELKDSLYSYLNVVMREFIDSYKNLLKRSTHIEYDALVSFQSLMTAVKESGYKLYLFIDEYDNFANEVMASKIHNNDRYADLVYGEGFLKTLFKNIKGFSSGHGLDRVFITGVSPVVMADISSGYNVASNIYRYPEFNDLCGFTATETQALLEQVIAQCTQQAKTLDVELAMRTMQQFYNGYCFNQHDFSTVYNPTLAIYFLEHLSRYCRYPDNLLDSNLSMDRDRISYITHLPNGAALIEKICDDSQAVIVPQLHDRFGVEDMLRHEQEEHELASLLYYLGVLTQDKVVSLGKLQLRIPNLVIRSLYVEKLRELLLPKLQLKDYEAAVETFFISGDLQPLCNFLQPRLDSFSNRDYRWVNEFAIKTAFLMLLFDDRLYIVDSEPELNRGYADFTLIARPDMRQYEMLDHVLEFKFIKLSELNLTHNSAHNLSDDELHALPTVQAAFQAAATQLQTYQPILLQRYGEQLRLQTSVVVAIGFERLLWQKLA